MNHYVFRWDATDPDWVYVNERPVHVSELDEWREENL